MKLTTKEMEAIQTMANNEIYGNPVTRSLPLSLLVPLRNKMKRALNITVDEITVLASIVEHADEDFETMNEYLQTNCKYEITVDDIVDRFGCGRNRAITVVNGMLEKGLLAFFSNAKDNYYYFQNSGVYHITDNGALAYVRNAESILV